MEVKLSKSELGGLDFTHVTNLERLPQAFSTMILITLVNCM